MHGERRGHIVVFLDFATNVGGSRTATSVKAVESESSRTEHEMVLKYRDGTYGNSPSLSLSLSLGTQEQIAPHQEANQLGYYLTRLSSIIGTPSDAPWIKQGYQEPDYRTGGTSTDRLQFVFRSIQSLLKGSSYVERNQSLSNPRNVEH